MGVLLITHDLGVVSEAGDRVIVMYCGKIVEEADVRSLFPAPAPVYGSLLQSIPQIDDDSDNRLYMIKGMVPNPLNMPQAVLFPTAVTDAWNAVPKKCRSSGRLTGIRYAAFYMMMPRKGEHKMSEVLMDVQHLSKHFTVETDFFGKPVSVLKAVDDVFI